MFMKSVPKMSILKSPIDLKNLEEELNEALRADELYKLQNDAKLRALEQKVPTYEDFRQMVHGAHLNPIKRDQANFKLTNPWNPIANSKPREMTEYKSTKPPVLSKSNNRIVNTNPNSYEEFIIQWELISDPERKFEYLWTIRHNLQTGIFRAELPPSLFGVLIDVCLKNVLKIENVKRVIDILFILSECDRFKLAVIFMSKTDLEHCKELFKKLLDYANTEQDLRANVNSLKKMYSIGE